jgi:hypothetical protein
MRHGVLPYLRELGELLGTRRGECRPGALCERVACVADCSGSPAAWGNGAGPLALLACVPGEGLDLGLISGVVYRALKADATIALSLAA